MKSLLKVLALVFVSVCFSVVVSAQVTPPTAPAKIGFVDSTRFSASTGGVNRLVAAIRTVDDGFRPDRDGIAASIKRLEVLQKDVPNESAAQRSARLEQAQTLQIDITRKQEDGRAA